MLREMRHVVQAATAIRSVLATRRDLLLEVLALHHQLAVLARSNRRFRTSDRLLWLFLRRFWPQWKDALRLVQPATVDRWHRGRFDRHRWRRRSRRPGRPPIDSQVRDLIGRLADDNRLWGAPRIHGELLKLGIVVSERTVSRYLRGRPRTSQTWRTFLANHLDQVTFISELRSPSPSTDDVVDAFAKTCCSAPSSNWRCASTECSLVAWHAAVRRTCPGGHPIQNHVRRRTGVRTSTSRAPPWDVRGRWSFGAVACRLRLCRARTVCDRPPCWTVRRRGAILRSPVVTSA
jgi:hypothetical protein